MSGSSARSCGSIATTCRLPLLGCAACALLMLFVLSAAALAQGVTGTVSGTVKDAQGGVVPGATVTLINEAQGTQLAPVTTNATGDFVVPNVAAGPYTVQVEMPSFRTLKLSGIAVSPGARIVLPPMTIEVGGASEQLVVTAEAPLVQTASGEKSFTVATESVSSLPLANRSYDALLGLMPGVNSTPGNLTPASRLGGGGDSNFMLDGATAMDPGVNRPAMRVSVEAIPRSASRPRPTRRNTVDPAACRSMRSRRAGRTSFTALSTTSSGTRSGTPTARPTSSMAIRRRSRTSATGDSPSAARSGGRAATTSCSSTTTRSSIRGRSATPSTVIACRLRWSGRAISRDRRTTSAIFIRTSRTRCCRAPATRRRRPVVLQTVGSWDGSRGVASMRPGSTS